MDDLSFDETDEPLTAEVRDPGFTEGVRQRTYATRELGATKLFHTKCPCCGYISRVDTAVAEKSIERRASANRDAIKVRLRNAAQRYFAECWGWATNLRKQHVPAPGVVNHRTTKQGVRSKAVEMAFQCAAGRSLRKVYLEARRRGLKAWFATGWHDAPRIGEMLFCCPLGDLFTVLQAIADDAPEFAYRLRRAADLALKRDGSLARLDLLDDPASQGPEGGGEAFDPASAVNL